MPAEDHNENTSPNQNSTKSFWGNTFGRLKTALAKTKGAVVDSILNRENDQPAPSQEENTGQSVTPTQPISSGQPAGLAQPIGLEQPGSPEPRITPAQSTAVLDRSIAIDEEYLEELEDKLIRADLGLPTVSLLMNHLHKSSRAKNWTGHDVQSFLKNEFSKILSTAANHRLNIKEGMLNVILIVGVNGTGKTTSIGKVCHRLRSEGKKILIAAGDTFRAAAESQLEIWAQRAACDLVRLPNGSDPGAVVYQAIKKATTENYDVLVIDTAGRLHNKANLMAELSKIQSVIDKNASNANFEALLVLDASTGQNGIQQARVFSEVCPLTGVILTKLDGTAKGGVIFSIANELKIPVKLIGLGEKIDDLQDFEPQAFVEALFQ